MRRAFLLFTALLLAPVAEAETVWFEVASHDGRASQSYLLPLSDAASISAAREALAERESGGSGPLVVARIRPGGDGLNRNLRDPAQRLWSWHVAGFEGFADLSIELCDGSPALVEAEPEAFAANTGGMICFWGYSIAAELADPPEFAITEALDGFWHSPGSEGSGFLIDVLAAQEQLALAWLRYAPVGGAEPQQQWLLGLGGLPSQHGQAAIELGLAQPAPAQGGDVPMTPVTSVRLEFHDCNRGELWVLEPNPVHLPLQRTVPRYACNPD